MTQNDNNGKGLIEQIEDAIPEDRKKMSFGGDGEDVIDVMENCERDMHKAGRHPDNEHPTCPLCKEARGEC